MANTCTKNRKKNDCNIFQNSNRGMTSRITEKKGERATGDLRLLAELRRKVLLRLFEVRKGIKFRLPHLPDARPSRLCCALARPSSSFKKKLITKATTSVTERANAASTKEEGGGLLKKANMQQGGQKTGKNPVPSPNVGKKN